MPRNYVRARPNRGLNIVQPKAALNSGQLYRAENVVFTRKTVKRRAGKLASHKPAVGTPAGVSLLKRFYNLATTGTITRFFIKAFGGVLYQTTTDWSDDTRTAVASASWTAISLPQTANNSLYSNYSSTTVSTLAGAWQSAISTKSWCYLQSDVTSADDNDKTEAVPIRTQGGKSFLHGLVPPAQLALADTDDEALPAGMRWTDPLRLAGSLASSALVKDPTRERYWFAYKDASTNNLMVNYYENGAIGTAVDTSGGTAVTATQSIAMCVDYEGNPSVVWIENTTTDLKYTYRQRNATTWTTESIDATAWQDCAAIIDPDNKVHVIADVGTGTAPSYFTKTGSYTTASWTAAEAVGTSGGGDGCAIGVTSANVPLVAYHVSAGANRSIYYATRASGAFVETELDTNGGSGTCGQYPDIKITNDDVPWVAYPKASTTKFADFSTGSWVLAVADASSGAGTTNPTRLAIGTLPQEVLDAAVSPSYSDDQYPIVGHLNRLAIREGTTPAWSAAAIVQQLGSFVVNSISILSSDEIIVSTQGNSIVDALIGTYSVYYYRLTAEYDNGVLGESRPSQPTQISLPFDIGIGGTNVLDLDDAGGRYDMTDDVSRIYVYRTVRYGTADGPYYRVGSVTCTNGAPTADFTDNVTDAELVLGRILDTDRYLPPKWRTGVFWKDRLVIGNLKCRKLDSTEGDLDSLDREADGIHKNRIRFSEAFHPDVFKANFFQDILPDGDSGSIQRLIVNPLNDALFVFMENDVVALLDPVGDTVTSLSYRPRNIANSHGTPARHSVVEYEGLLFYWTKNGIEVINGLTARNITADTIGSLWNMTDSTDAAYASRINMAQIGKVAGTVHVDEDGERIYWAYPAASSTYNNRVLVLDYARWRDSGYTDDGVFSIWTMDISCWARWDGEGDRGELFGGEALSSRGPWVHRVGISNQDEVGNTAGTITTSAVAPFYIHMGHDDAGTSERRKRWIAARVDGRIPTVASTGACSVVLAFDIDEGAVSGTMDTVTWTQGGIKRYSRNLPRAAIGVHGAVEITGTDGTPGASGGSPPFELYEVAMTVQDMEARTARG